MGRRVWGGAGLEETSIYSDWRRAALFGKHGASAEERGATRAVTDGSCWTEARSCEAGYLDLPLCLWRHAAIGNMRHRLYGCVRLEECEGRRLRGDLMERGAEVGEEDLFWTRLMPMGPKKPRAPEGVVMVWVGGGSVLSGEVYGDGSVKGLEGLKRGGRRLVHWM